MAYVILSISIINFLIGLIISLRVNSTRENSVFLLFSITASLWTFTNFMVKINPSTELIRVAYALGMLVALLSLVWVYRIVGKSFDLVTKYVLYPIGALIVPISLFTPLVFRELSEIVLLGYEGEIGILFYLYAAVLASIVFVGLEKLYVQYEAEDRKQHNARLKYIFWGFFVFATVSFIANFIIPILWGSFAYVNFDDFGFLVFLIFILYAIVRHQLFDIKVVATELFVGTLWMFMVARLFLSANTSERLIDIAVLAATVIFGVLVIRSVLKEIRTKDRIELLTRELGHKNAKLELLDQQKSEFLAMASHQLRSPLTAIKGYSSMLIERTFGQLPPQVDEALERITISSDSLVEIIDDFLNISRIEQGRMKFEYKVIDVSAMVSDVVTEISPRVEKAGIKMTMRANGSGPFTVRADEGKLRQVFENLIDNASKYTKEGTISVTVTRSESEGVIHTAITDTGIGIPAEVLPLLFQKFSRSKEAGKANIQGTGLGLYVAKKLVDAQDGKVWAESQGEGKGSTFHVELPIFVDKKNAPERSRDKLLPKKPNNKEVSSDKKA